jgi:hypothetical protein
MFAYKSLEGLFKSKVRKEKTVPYTAIIHKLPGNRPIFFCAVPPEHNMLGNINH